MQIRIGENRTHWKSDDVLALVRAAYKESGVKLDQTISVIIRYQIPDLTPSNVNRRCRYGGYTVYINLPKRGPRRSALEKLAEAALDREGPVLPRASTGKLLNYLVWDFAFTHTPGSAAGHLDSERNSPAYPKWAPPGLWIEKDPDPEKDSRYQAIILKHERAISRAKNRIKKRENELKNAEAGLARAKSDLKDAKKKLRDAKKRRGL